MLVIFLLLDVKREQKKINDDLAVQVSVIRS
jgi:hypothetical protein